MFTRVWKPALAAAVAAMAIGGAGLASASTSGGDGPGAMTFRVFDRTVASHNVDVDNSHSFSIGDEFIFTDKLWNVARTSRVGILHGLCTVVSMRGGGVAKCSETAQLFGRGTLEGSGTVGGNATRFAQAIVGGTGQFDTATGQFLVHQLNENDSIVTVDLDS
jgi:hypothetical protein